MPSYYPYTNFHELNLEWFMKHFEEIFTQWTELNNTMLEWKTETTDELELWVSNTEADLTTWKENFEDLFNTTFSNLSDIQTAAENARDAAIDAQHAAEAAQDAAEDAAATFSTDTTLAVGEKAADALVTGAYVDSEGYIQYNNGIKDGYENVSAAFGTMWRYNNIIELDGEFTGTNQFVKISGGKNRTTSSSSARGWVKSVPFIAGHEYEVEFKMLGGTFTPAAENSYVSIQIVDNDSGLFRSVSAGNVDQFKWFSTNGLLNLRIAYGGTFSNAKYLFTIKDITGTGAYRLSNAWNTEIDTSANAMNMNNVKSDIQSVSMLCISDLHWNDNAQESPMVAKKILEKSAVNYFYMLGDYYGTGAETPDDAIYEVETCINSFNGLPMVPMVMRGNHDLSGSNFTEVERFNSVYKRWIMDPKYTVYSGDYRPCEAITFDDQMFHYVLIDWLPGDTESGQYSAGSLTPPWLTDVMDTLLPTIIITHAIYKDLGLNTLEPAWLLDSFQDYASNIVCFICGHAHHYALRRAYSTNVPVLILNQDSMDTDGAKGAITEQCLSGITISAANDGTYIDLVAIGRGTDRTITPSTPNFTE